MATYKDLTWKDIMHIVEIADNVLESTDKKRILAFGKEGYYVEVLNMVTKFKESESNQKINGV